MGNNQTRKICHSCQDKADEAKTEADWERLRKANSTTQSLPPITEATPKQYVKALFADCDKTPYAMLALANELLFDKDFVLGACEGIEAATQLIEQTVVAHFGGSPTLGTMLAAYRKSPDIATWEEYQFKIQAMIDLAFPKEPRSTTHRTDWQRRCQELQLENAQLKHELAEALKQKGGAKWLPIRENSSDHIQTSPSRPAMTGVGANEFWAGCISSPATGKLRRKNTTASRMPCTLAASLSPRPMATR